MLVACGQMEATTIDQAERVWPVVERLALEAAEAHVDMLVLPEATYPAYVLGSAERYRQPDIERSSAVLDRYAQIASTHKFWLIAGFVEEVEDTLYNSAAVFDRTGQLVRVVRKHFLWDCDHQWFTSGDEIQAFDTEFGRMGVIICADARIPEVLATLVADGAEICIQPTAWVNGTTIRRTYRNIQPDFLIQARAMEFGIPFVCCSKSGREGTLEYVGQSRVVSAAGKVLDEAPIGGVHLIGDRIERGTPRPAAMDDATRERLLSPEPPYAPTQPGKKCLLPLRIGADPVAAALEKAGARVSRFVTADMKSFAPMRRAALDGAQVFVVKGRVLSDTLLRARAAENRVFAVLATADATQLVISPDGTLLWRHADWSDSIELDLAQADVKEFTPTTNIWTQRRVACYRF